jgi:tetratricopeptide (TPR) repeat protein
VTKRFEEALRYYSRALELAPGHEQILAELARIHFDLKEDRKALRIIARGLPTAVAESPLVALCHNEGRDFIITSQSDRAIACFRLLADRLPRNTHQYDYLLGELYRTEDDHKEAIRWYLRATRRDDPLPEAFIKLAFLELESDPEQAMEELERGVGLLPENAMVLMTLAALYVQLERAADAVPLYERLKALVEDPGKEAGALKANFYLNYGAACEQAGLLEKATAVFQEGLEKHPGTAPILNYLAYMWAEQGTNLEQAQAHALKALEGEPDNGAYLDTLGWVYYKKGEYRPALEKIERALTLMKDDPTINEHLGDVHEALDNREAAIIHWKKSFLLEPKNPSLAIKLKAHDVDLKALRKQAETLTH